jgi:glyoxylate/hydroxypyruvate/2-ketogluconate reductase
MAGGEGLIYMKKSILISHAVFPETIARLSAHFHVQANQDNVMWSREEFIGRLQGKSGLLTGTQRIDAALLAACPDLKICANMAVGYNNFDLSAMTAAGVIATNTPDVLSEATADMGFALLMATARRLSEAEAFLRQGQWKGMRFDMLLGADIHGSTLGILGMGRIGRAVAKRGALGFNMNVIYHNRSRLSSELEAQSRARYVSKQELFKQADHVVIVLPYTAESHHTVCAEQIALMKPTATLINIGRGGLVDENALAAALAANKILGAGLDVFEGEPNVNPALLALKNVVLSPHIGSATTATRHAMANLAADNLIGYLTQGQPKTPLNPEVLAA